MKSLKTYRNIQTCFNTTRQTETVIAEDYEGYCIEFKEDDEVYLKSEADKVIAELEQRLEDTKATAYAESVDAVMRERRLRRSLWLARLRSLRNFSVLSYFQTLRAKGKESNMDFNEMAYRIDLACVKCRMKAEEYK